MHLRGMGHCLYPRAKVELQDLHEGARLGKSKGPRVKVKSAEVEQEPIAPSGPHPVIARTAKMWSVLIAIGSVGGFVSLVDRAWTAAVAETKPDVRPLNLSSDPFSLPFVIKNRSAFFAMTDATWVCGVNSVVGPQGASLNNIGLIPRRSTVAPTEAPSHVPSDILPGRSLLARCPIAGAGANDATITPIVRYKTLWLTREYSEASFTWLSKANPPQWIEGRPL